MKFLVPNYSCLQNPWLGGYRPQIHVLSVLCPQLNLLNPPPPNKIPGYATGLGDEECGTRDTKSVNITVRQRAKNKTQKYEKIPDMASRITRLHTPERLSIIPSIEFSV